MSDQIYEWNPGRFIVTSEAMAAHLAAKDATIASLEEQATLSAAKIARLEAEKATLSAALGLAEEALKKVDFIQESGAPGWEDDGSGDCCCPWCGETTPTHAASCERQAALSAIASAKAGEVGG